MSREAHPSGCLCSVRDRLLSAWDAGTLDREAYPLRGTELGAHTRCLKQWNTASDCGPFTTNGRENMDAHGMYKMGRTWLCSQLDDVQTRAQLAPHDRLGGKGDDQRRGIVTRDLAQATNP